MNKMYLVIIGVLLVVALGVGGYAVYKATNQPTKPTKPASPPPTSQKASPPPTTAPSEKKLLNEIPLSIDTPLDGSTVSASSVIISGKTIPNAEMSINETNLTANSKGDFSSRVTLDEGENFFEITAADSEGKSSVVNFKVSYEPLQ